LMEIGGATIRDRFEKGPVKMEELEKEEEPVVREEISEEQLIFHLKTLTELLDTFEKDEVENKIKELSAFCYGETNLEDMLKPISERVKQFDFLTAAEEVAKLLQEGGSTNE